MSGLAAAGTLVAVMACGQRVFDDGYLVGDLDCTADEVSIYPGVSSLGRATITDMSIVGRSPAVSASKRSSPRDPPSRPIGTAFELPAGRSS